MLLDLSALGVAIVTVLAMEPWSRIVHEHLWHRALYVVHRTHHPPEGQPRPLVEANDAFAVVHAVPATVMIGLGFWGIVDGVLGHVLLGVGSGMALYGFAYTVAHDGLAHGRLPVAFLNRSRWLRRIRAAHEIHHRDGGPPYGFFRGPAELKAASGRTRGRFGASRRSEVGHADGAMQAPDDRDVGGGLRGPAPASGPEL
ncbi:MAG: sterol desaturase family protein [Myxococcota bacterium]